MVLNPSKSCYLALNLFHFTGLVLYPLKPVLYPLKTLDKLWCYTP